MSGLSLRSYKRAGKSIRYMETVNMLSSYSIGDEIEKVLGGFRSNKFDTLYSVRFQDLFRTFRELAKSRMGHAERARALGE